MPLCALPLLTAVIFLADDFDPADKAAKVEARKFQGAWTVTEMEEDGKKASKEKLRSVKWVFEDDDYTLKMGTALVQGKFRPNPARKPQTLDLHVMQGPGKGKTQKGIYKFLGAEIMACFRNDGKERPKEFTARAGSGQTVYVLKKTKS